MLHNLNWLRTKMRYHREEIFWLIKSNLYWQFIWPRRIYIMASAYLTYMLSRSLLCNISQCNNCADLMCWNAFNCDAWWSSHCWSYWEFVEIWSMLIDLRDQCRVTFLPFKTLLITINQTLPFSYSYKICPALSVGEEFQAINSRLMMVCILPRHCPATKSSSQLPPRCAAGQDNRAHAPDCGNREHNSCKWEVLTSTVLRRKWIVRYLLALPSYVSHPRLL